MKYQYYYPVTCLDTQFRNHSSISHRPTPLSVPAASLLVFLVASFLAVFSVVIRSLVALAIVVFGLAGVHLAVRLVTSFREF